MDAIGSNMEKARGALKRHFGYDHFRPGQEAAIESLLEGRDVLAVMPTGAGKSICYQVPGAVLDGLVLVVSPLVSLMGDQVRALLNAGIRGAYLNSTLTPGQQAEVLRRAAGGAYDVMYVAPERLDDPRFVAFCGSATIPLVAIDEAHCVSQWGQDFRPAYLGIGKFIASLPQRPAIVALTATATERVRNDIVQLLDLHNPARIVTGFDRTNLYFGVERLEPKRKLARICSYSAERPNDSGIIYCSTRKEVEKVHEALVERGVRATRYHAGLSHAERTRNQEAFINDDAPVMVATNAFGMGIDKSNVRYVLHNNLPTSLEAYYQEAGRAGRDGEAAQCILLWSESDLSTCRFFVEADSNNDALTREEAEVVRQTQRRLLSVMVGYCLTTECLRSYILSYFGEKRIAVCNDDNAEGSANSARNIGSTAWSVVGGARYADGTASNADGEGETACNADGVSRSVNGVVAGAGVAAGSVACVVHNADSAGETAVASDAAALSGGCARCSNCVEEVDAVDVTREARAIMRCVQEMRGRYGKGLVADVLRGSKSQKVLEFHLDEAKCYGTLDTSAAELKDIIELLAIQGYLEITEGKYPLVGFGARARDAARDEFRLTMKRTRRAKAHSQFGETSAQGASSATTFADAPPGSEELFERLRALRKRLATEAGMPPYIIFSDAALRDMCMKRPSTDVEFLAVNGVGATKLERYGADFLAEIVSFQCDWKCSAE